MAVTKKVLQFNGVHTYCAQPESGARGGVILLPAIYGLDAFVCSYADSLAEIGLTAMVWDQYGGEGPPAGLEEALTRAAQLKDDVVDQMVLCMDYMLGELRMDAVGTLGFCLGGRFALMFAARDERMSACAALYPSIHEPLLANQQVDAIGISSQIRCPVTMVYTRNDRVTGQQSFHQLKDELCKRSSPTMVQLYPDAEHGFMLRPNIPANKAATELAAPQINAFLKTCLSRPVRT